MKYSIVEIMDAFNECAKELEEKNKEIERLNNDFTTLKLLQQKHLEEIERLNKELELQKLKLEDTKKELIEQDKYIDKLKIEYDKEIERLTELCNKYEEEHKTTFETWKKDIKENELLHSIIKEVREKLESVQIFGLRSGKTLIATLLNDILEILDKVGETDESKR